MYDVCPQVGALGVGSHESEVPIPLTWVYELKALRDDPNLDAPVSLLDVRHEKISRR